MLGHWGCLPCSVFVLFCFSCRMIWGLHYLYLQLPPEMHLTMLWWFLCHTNLPPIRLCNACNQDTCSVFFFHSLLWWYLQHYLLCPSISYHLFHWHQCPYSMPACFLDALFQLLLPDLKKQPSNWSTQIHTTYSSIFSKFGQITGVSKWDSISYSYIELWSGLSWSLV